MITFYQAWSEGTDGMDRRPVGYFETRRLAEKAAKGKGPMGYGNGDVVEIKVYTEEDEKKEARMQEVRKRALKKLDAEEKEALNIKD